MALVTCKDCGQQISADAKACPQCGAPPPPKSNVVALSVLGVIALVVVTKVGADWLQNGADDRTTGRPAAQHVSPASIPAPPKPAPPPPSPAYLKELDRVTKLAPLSFCMHELHRLKGKKSPLPQPWADAVAARARDLNVSASDLENIQGGKVTIGMNTCAAVASWGQPESVNRSTYATSTHEQWVYGGRNYLYFDDSQLTAIQN